MSEQQTNPDPAWLRRLTTAEGERLPVRDLNTRARRGRSVGQLLDPALRRLLGRRGVALAPLIAHWPEIVGPALARQCAPHRLVMPRKGASGGGTLHLKASAGAVATELVHRAPMLCERINTHLGFGAVSSIKVAQGVFAPAGRADGKGPALPAAPAKAPPAAALADLDSRLAGVDDPELRAVLQRLGRAVLTSRRGRRGR